MPRAPKTATQSKRPRGEEKQKDAMKEAKGQRKANGQALPLIGELAGACGAWAANPSGALPLEQIRELSHKAWEAKMGSWSSSTAPVKDLDMGPLEDALPAVFKALERTCLASESGSLRAQNGLAGLALAALVLDLSAMRTAPEVQPGEEAVAKAMSFLWHQARFFLPGRLEAKAFSDASTLALALARGLRSVHHVMARRSYAGHALPAASLVHKSAPLAGQCAALAAGGASTQAAKALATLGDAAGDLLVALSGCGCTEASMQSSAVSEMSRLCTQGPMYQGCSSGSLLALLLRSVAAQLLPLKIHSKAPKELQILCRDHLARSEARASALCAALVQHGLLEAERKDQVQLLVQQLVALCQDPRWAAAPLLCRRLALALFRVAGASRAVELDCAQREEATKLLASVAGALCAQRAGSSEPVHVAPLKRWAGEGGQLGALTRFLASDSAASASALRAPAGELQSSAVPAGSGWCNAAALLCFAAEPREKAAKGKEQAAKPRDATAWALQAWAEFGHLPAPGDASDASEPPIRATRCAASLYRKLQWGDASSLLSRTRTGALESLLSLAKSSPLAHVRRQALLGLGAACATEAELICSRCMAEAVAAGLQDEAAFARLAALELVAQLKPQGADGSARVKELRQLARQRLADCSVLVRRGAFRAALGWLEELEMPGQLAEAGELLRRLRTETPQIRAQALPVLQRLLFDDDAEVSVARLRAVHVQSGAGCVGVRDLLAARCKALEEKGGEAQATAAMEHLAKCTMKLLAGSSPETVEDSSREGSAPSFALLEQLSLERPEALHRQLGQFLPWLAASDVSGSLERPMAACGILAQVLPSWGAAASSLAKQKMARDLARSLARLLDEHTAPATDLGQLARQAVRCLAAVAEHLGAAGPQARELLMGHFGRSIRVLAEDVEDGQRLCRHSWILGSLLEFLDRGSLEQLAQAMARLPSSGASLAQCARSALLLLSEGCRSKSARPAMISALGFALKRFPELLDAEEAGVASPLALLRLALQGPAKARAAEAFAALSAGYQEAAEKGSPDCVKQPARSSASVAAQKLASLQPELLGALDAACYGPLLAGLRSLCDLGVLHPASTLPNILAATVAAPAIAAAHARPLLLRLVESSPPLLAQRLGAGLQLAAEKLAAEGYVEVYSESWRFQAVCEAYAEFLEGRALRDQFLTSLLGDLGSGLKLQLVVGILARLPLSKEPELARVFHCAVRFLTLKVAPLLDEAAEDAPGAEDARLCACGAVLHRLCVQWLGLVGGELVKQMRETWAQPTLATDFDQALPMSFKRRSVVDLSELWRLEGVESHGLLLREMENSPLLGKAVRPAALAAPKAVPKKRSAEEPKGPKGPKAKARKQATEAAASAKAAAVAMSKAAAGA